jgi:hypothetical protein
VEKGEKEGKGKYPSMLEGVEAARCDALKCGGTYADFVPLIPRDAKGFE